MRPFLPLLLLLFSDVAFGQEAPATPPTVHPKSHAMIGLNITQTLGSFFGTSNSNISSDPFLLSLRVGNESIRWRLGLNFRIRNTNEDGFQTSRIVTDRTFDFRTGVEWSYTVSSRFDMYWGLDAVLRTQKEVVNTTFGGGTANLDTHSTGIGTGPVLGFMWRAHPRVRLSTESSLYTKGEKIVSSFPDISKTPFKEFDFRPILPTSFYINFYF